MAGLTLDAGALIAAERGDPKVWRFIKAALVGSTVVPAPALAQAWRGGPRSARLSMLLAGCYIEAMDDVSAKAAGVLCGRSGTTDIVDAAVVASAASRGDTVLTSDPDDLRALTAITGRVRIVDIAALGEIG